MIVQMVQLLPPVFPRIIRDSAQSIILNPRAKTRATSKSASSATAVATPSALCHTRARTLPGRGPNQRVHSGVHQLCLATAIWRAQAPPPPAPLLCPAPWQWGRPSGAPPFLYPNPPPGGIVPFFSRLGCFLLCRPPPSSPPPGGAWGQAPHHRLRPAAALQPYGDPHPPRVCLGAAVTYLPPVPYPGTDFSNDLVGGTVFRPMVFQRVSGP